MRILLCALLIFLSIKILSRTIRKLKAYFFKKKIEKNPLIGTKDLDGSFLYKDKGYALRYRIEILSSGQKKINWISYKYRLTAFEEFIYKVKRFLKRFIFYTRFKPSLIIPLFLIIIILYVWVLIPQTTKINFYNWSVSRMVGISPEQVEYKGGGWFEVYGKRIIPEDGRSEPLTFTINPLHWLFFSDYGYVTRWRGKEYGGYKTHDLKLNKERQISIEGRPPLSQDIEIEEEGIRVIDR